MLFLPGYSERLPITLYKNERSKKKLLETIQIKKEDENNLKPFIKKDENN